MDDRDDGAVLRVAGVGKRFGRHEALRGCSFALPQGRVAALVGPNGAGKTTLLRMAVGLARPTAGRIEVLGADPSEVGMPPGTSFVAQDKPLYRRFRVGEMLRAAAALNPGGRWDGAHAAALITAAGVDVSRRIAELSAGQRARVAIALALGRRPRLLLLDEPLAELDPVARREVMGTVLAAVADSGMTVLLSSHVVADIEDSCDHLVVLRDGGVVLDGAIEDLRARHRVLSGPAAEAPAGRIVNRTTSGRHAVTVVEGSADGGDPPSLDDLVIAYLQPSAERVTS
ncbi:ATP-binding cassette domain-containing protein [Pseudonocardia sp. WMMC193]|uniref:ATP-binding cassette domain-containing protein n=1 Tax=Pseudonocardia sp. WMMC193 TaxID=2911965 RepID=UPI001F480F01|nr:ABC transporter ATP-binding protein [Pseudonocardia sp. WMMC193]MCF7548580.1 ABC transporter ATP-binding protein [Pseudonocardia sp. WMMC193]